MASPAPSPRGKAPSAHLPVSETNAVTPQAAAPIEKTTSTSNRKSGNGESMEFPLTAVAASVSPLPTHVASRWAAEAGEKWTERSSSHEKIDSKLSAAEAKRQAFLQWVATRSVARSAARTTRRESREGGAPSCSLSLSLTGEGRAFEGLNLQSKLDEEAAPMQKESPYSASAAAEEEEAAAAPRATPHATAGHRLGGGDGDPEHEVDHLRALHHLRAAAAGRRLQRAWRSFRGERSSELALAFVSTGVLGKSDEGDGGGLVRDGDSAAAASPPSPVILGVGAGSGGSPSERGPPALSHRASADGIAASEFDDLASTLTSPATLGATRSLLARFEARLALRPEELAHSGVEACHGRLVASFSARKRAAGSTGGGGGRPPSTARPAPSPPTLPTPPRRRLPSLPGGRYPLRVFLSSLMMVAHPEVVFRTPSGDRERALREAAAALRAALCELLASMIAGGRTPSSSPKGRGLPLALARALPTREEAGGPESPPRRIPPLSEALSLFDLRWAGFLDRFVGWKAADAAALEADLVRAAVVLEASRISVVAGSAAASASPGETVARPPSPAGSAAPPAPSPETRPRPRRAASGPDAAEVSEGVERDLELLRSKARELGGRAAERRLEAALEGCRARARAAAEAAAEAAEAAEASTEAAAAAAAPPLSDAARRHPPPAPDASAATALPSSVGSSAETILNLPSIARATPGTLPPPSKTEHMLWGLIKSGGEPAGMLRLAEAIWGDAAAEGVALPSSCSCESVEAVEREAADAEIEAARASRAASAEVASSGVDSPESTATDAAVAAARATDAARWARARLAFCKESSGSLGGGGNSGAALVAASALSTAARRVAGTLGSGARASEAAHALRREYDLMSLRDEFSLPCPGPSSGGSFVPGLDVEKVLSRLERLSETLRSMCAPARDAAHEAAASSSRSALGASLARAAEAANAGGSSSPSPAAVVSARIALATALASSLRKADAGARLLQADVAAVEARALASGAAAAAAAGGGPGFDPLASRARSLLRLRAALPTGSTEEELSSRLPLTRAWLAESCGKLPVVEGGLPPAGEEGVWGRERPVAPPTGLPSDLRSGIASSRSLSRGVVGVSAKAPRHELVLPAPRGGWRAAFRAGLLSLVAAPTPLAASASAAAAAAAEAGPGVPAPVAVPEVVALEFAELRAAQHEFQVVAVCAAGVMLVGGARASASSAAAASGGDGGSSAPPSTVPLSSTFPSPSDVRARLRALLSDSATSATLPDLSAELAMLSSPPTRASPRPTPPESLEREMRAGLGRLLRRGSAPFEALSGALEAALAARLLCGSRGADGAEAADAAVASALARAGATVLTKDVDALAERISRVAAVTESVFGPLLEHVVEGLF